MVGSGAFELLTIGTKLFNSLTLSEYFPPKLFESPSLKKLPKYSGFDQLPA